MPKVTPLDRQWTELMSLCETEARCRETGKHPRLLRLLADEIERLARHMGFEAAQIQTREFRAERQGGHIVGLATDQPAKKGGPTGAD